MHLIYKSIHTFTEDGFCVVWAHFSVVSITGGTQKVPLFDLESPERYSVDFFLSDS